MSAPTFISPEHLIDNLRLLCAQPSSAGHDHELELTADLVQRLMQQSGLETRVVRTAGAPLVIGQRSGTQPFTLLLYHHYDTTPTGAWRAWNHDPFTLAERDQELYARGVSLGKGPLVAHLSALAALLDVEKTLPCKVIVIAEGEGLIGSPHLAATLAELGSEIRADACVASGGERDAHGCPYCYTGSKGSMRVQLNVSGAIQPLAPGMAATVSNPLWRLIWALNSIKGEDEDIKIDGFYDSVDGPSHETSRALRKMSLDEAGRLAAWGLSQFLFGMTSGALTGAEATLPTCNVSLLTTEPHSGIDNIPIEASAVLDFQLVPQQQVETIFEQLRTHLESRGFDDVQVTLLPGGYGAASTPTETSFIQQLAGVGTQVYGSPLPLLPMGSFALPLNVLQQTHQIPAAVIGCLRPGSGVYAANEHAPLDDLLRHGQLLMELIWACSGCAEEI